MSQTPGEEQRRIVVVFSGPSAVSGKTYSSQQVTDVLAYFAMKFGWKLKANHDVSVNAKIQVQDVPQT
jgi:hypothetical protein